MYDFGLRTARPEHHVLLDWLAVEFMESGWSFKQLHRLIVSSQAYRMRSADSGPGDPNVTLDPDNRFVWRMNVGRMEGEVVRDTILFLAGRLDSRIGGPDGPVASAESGTRRTIYYRYASGDTVPFLSMFDAANVTECYRRHETIVPQQALALSNSGMVLSRAADIASVIDDSVSRLSLRERALAERMRHSGGAGTGPPSWIRRSSAFWGGRRASQNGLNAWRGLNGFPRYSGRTKKTPARRKPAPAGRSSTSC